MSSNRAHHCHATDCVRDVKPEYLMCGRHWRMLKTYRVGQCNDFNPSSEYLEAAKIAIIAVAEQEQREPDTRLYDMMLLQRG